MKKTLLYAAAALAMGAAPAAASAADVTVVLDADFTQFTEGSPSAPADFPSYGTGSFSSYFSGWFSSKVAQAGGALMVKDGGYVQTSSQNLSANGGVVRVSARVRMLDAYGGVLKVSVGYSASQNLMLTDSSWHDVSIILGGGTSSSRIKAEPMLSASGLLMQNLRLEQSPAFVAAPTAQQPLQADGKSFTARWSSVRGATSYLLDVYSYNGTEKAYLLRDQDTGNVTSYKVTGLDPAVTYYYTVRATNGTGVSEPSDEIRVVKVIYSLATPGNLRVSTHSGDIAATWDAVPDAQEYILSVSRIFTCPADTTVNILTEDFDRADKGELDNIEFIFSNHLDRYTVLPGWDGSDLAIARGHMVLTPYGHTGWLSTPPLDLRGKDGSCTVSASLACGAFGSFYEGQATAYLLNAAGDTLQAKDILLGKGFADYQVTFVQGADSCRVVLAYAGDYKLFINSLSVDQLKGAGQKVVSWLGDIRTPDLTATFPAERGKGYQLSATVTAVAETVSLGEIAEIWSDPTAPVVVDYTLGVASAADDGAQVSVSGRDIVVIVPNACRAALYDLSGRLLMQTDLQPGGGTIAAPASGALLLRVGDRIHKLMVK